VVSTKDWSTIRDFRAVPRGPIWALAFTGDGQRVLSGGLDDHVSIWPIADAVSVAASDAPHRFHASKGLSNGARQFARKCSICHTLTPDGARRAGPSLYALFGRRAGALPGYDYSDALDGADITWSAETIDRLFDLGPDHYTPGSKMPMQRITRSEDRADLIAYLREATAPDADRAGSETGEETPK
jgi:cytochrome c